jgi:Protein of unknown function (DUF2891)
MIPTNETSELNAAQVGRFARLALAGIDCEYPNKPNSTLTREQDLLSPRVLHPAFFGCFDWHSAVHGHWLLVRLLRLFPDMADAANIRARLAAHLTTANLEAEAAYFDDRSNHGFERMYGWAWALRLAAELRAWNDSAAQDWARNFAPLEQKFVALTHDYLPRLTYPIRTGVHPDMAFALAQILDYARAVGDKKLEQLVVERAKNYYLNDRDYPVNYEPSGEDFFSPGLNVADLMWRVLKPDEFSRWLDAYLPGLREGKLGNWAAAAEVSDLTDGRIVHLVGLNLSRAWTMRGVVSALAPDDPRRKVLESASRLHSDAGLKSVFSGSYEGEHWLATFAVYLLSDAGLNRQT